jgi:hypothetical protein
MFTTFKSHRWFLAVALAFALGLTAACGGDALRDSDDAGSAGNAPPGGSDEAIVSSSGELGPQTGRSESFDGAVAPEASGGSGTADVPGALPALLDRKIIMTASIALETDDVSGGFEEVGRIANTYGGFVASSSFGNAGDTQTASITIRVPGDRYQNAVNDLRGLGKVTDFDSNSSDVTEEFTDLESRLRGLRAVEAQYMEFLSRATTIDEVLTVQDRLNGVRVEMEQIQGRINLLSNQTDLATITAHLAPPAVTVEPPSEEGKLTPAEALENGWEASLAVLTGAAVVTLAVLAFSWWLIPVALIVAYIVRRLAKTSSSPGPPAQPPIATT